MKFNHLIAQKGLLVGGIILVAYGIWAWQFSPATKEPEQKRNVILSETEVKQAEPVDQPPTTKTKQDAAQTQSATAPAPQKPQISQQAKTKPAPTSTITAKPVSQPTQSANTAISPADNSLAGQIVALIDQERAKNGLAVAYRNGHLDQASYLKSKDMGTKNYFAHTAPNGTSDISFVNQVGYKYQAIGINLAKGNFANANDLVQAWMNSPGHRKNILADFGQQIGIGIYGEYYTMMIGKPF